MQIESTSTEYGFLASATCLSLHFRELWCSFSLIFPNPPRQSDIRRFSCLGQWDLSPRFVVPRTLGAGEGNA